MSLFESLGLYIVRSLGFLAQWLGEICGPLPWPLVIALVAIPLLFIANLFVWFLRGVVWPVRCKHPATTVRHNGDKACRVWVAGEWTYCRHHNKKAVNHKNQEVDPNLPRWKTIERGKIVDRKDVKGMNSSVSLFFYHGFARKPLQVIQALPEVFNEQKKNFSIMVKRLKHQSIEEEIELELQGSEPTEAEREKYRGINVRAERADQALFVLKFMVPIALLSIIISTLINGPLTIIFEYLALFIIWTVIEIVRQGVLKEPDDIDWRFHVIKETVIGFSAIVGIAIICMLLDDFIFPILDKIITT